jgi:hypothetical protein
MISRPRLTDIIPIPNRVAGESALNHRNSVSFRPVWSYNESLGWANKCESYAIPINDNCWRYFGGLDRRVRFALATGCASRSPGCDENRTGARGHTDDR